MHHSARTGDIPRPPVNLREAESRRIFVAASVLVPANRIRAGIGSLQESGQVVTVVLVADRANKLPIERQALELWNKRIPALGVPRDGHTIPVVFVAEFIVDQGVPEDGIAVANHARIISENVGIAQAVQGNEWDGTDTFDGLLCLYLDRVGEVWVQRYPHNTDMDLLH